MDIDILTDSKRFDEWYGSVGTDTGMTILLTEFCDSPPERREIIWRAFLELAFNGNSSEIAIWKDELLKALANESCQIRRQALSALTDMADYLRNDDEVHHALSISLYDLSQKVREQAIYASSNFASETLLREIMRSLHQSDSYRPAVDDPDKRCLWHALFALDGIVDKLELSGDETDRLSEGLYEVLTMLVKIPNRSDLDIWKVGDSLGEHIRGSLALIVLRQMFANPDVAVRHSAVHGLGHLGGDEALRLIHLALSDADPTVREEAQKALAESGRN